MDPKYNHVSDCSHIAIFDQYRCDSALPTEQRLVILAMHNSRSILNAHSRLFLLLYRRSNAEQEPFERDQSWDAWRVQTTKLVITTGGKQGGLAFVSLLSRAAFIVVVILIVKKLFSISRMDSFLCHSLVAPSERCFREIFLIPSLCTSCIPSFDMCDVRRSLEICILCSSVLQDRWYDSYRYDPTLTLPASANFNPDTSMNIRCSIVTYFRKHT